MLRPRITVCLLMKDSGLIKTVQFKNEKYVGDPLNTLRLFNEMSVDEIMVLDIGASARGASPNFDFIRKMAQECRAPLTYGGGVKCTEQARKIIGLGVEKVAVGSLALENRDELRRISDYIGRQSLAVVLDVKKTGLLRGYELLTHNGTKRSGVHPAKFARELPALGVGEIIVNSIDNDGCMAGYDLNLVESIWHEVDVPVTALGGAGSENDFRLLLERFGVIGCAAGSMFVFKGKYRAVLVQYPTLAERQSLINLAYSHNPPAPTIRQLDTERS